MAYKHIQIPEDGEKITISDSGELNVPVNPIIPFIEGDGIGTDVTAADVHLLMTTNDINLDTLTDTQFDG